MMRLLEDEQVDPLFGELADETPPELRATSRHANNARETFFMFESCHTPTTENSGIKLKEGSQQLLIHAQVPESQILVIALFNLLSS